MKLARGGVLSKWAKFFGSGEQKNENYFAKFRSCSVYNVDSSAAKMF